MILLPRFGRWLVLFIGVVVFPTVVSQPAISATVTKSKDAFIQEILDKLTFIYTRDPEPATVGKTFKVTIKNFSVNDEETYVIIDGIARTYYWHEPTDDFWTVTLPRGLKIIDPEYYKGDNLSILLGGQHRVEIVRKDLVNTTRKSGIVREITIPKQPKPLK